MNISVFGLGYVGAVSAACLARDGHCVVGVDPNPAKVDLINQGRAPIVETGLDELIAQAVSVGLLGASGACAEAVQATRLSLLCVGTPSQSNGSLDLSHVRAVCAQIGEALREKSEHHVVVARSTMLPGSARAVVIDTLEAHSGKRAGVDFGVCVNPEFLREGTAIFDYDHPPKTVIGEDAADGDDGADGANCASDAGGMPAAGKRAGDLLEALYAHLDAPVIRTDIATAEMVKYSDNAWHALKVAFANEIGNFCKAAGIDGSRVMDIFCRDTKLNLSPYYMKPGFAFGGSCLPKDVRALTHRARSLDLELPVLDAILPSNERQIRRGIRMIIDQGHRKIGFLGFSFKAGTDDLRESPLVEVIETLIGKGYQIRLYDRSVNLACLTGANQQYLLHHIPHVASLMVPTMPELLAFAETVVVGNAAPEFRSVRELVTPDQHVVDLVRIGPDISAHGYDGICW